MEPQRPAHTSELDTDKWEVRLMKALSDVKHDAIKYLLPQFELNLEDRRVEGMWWNV